MGAVSDLEKGKEIVLSEQARKQQCHCTCHDRRVGQPSTVDLNTRSQT